MTEGNLREIYDHGSIYREVRVSEGSSDRKSTVCINQHLPVGEHAVYSV